MPSVSLTDRFCGTVKPGQIRVDYFDDKTQGLALRVAPSGTKTFTLHFGPRTRRARLTLGRYPRLSLAKARALALEALSREAIGEDPRYSGSVTLSDVARAYFAEHVRLNLRSAKAIERRLTKNVLEAIGSTPIGELHRRDLNRTISAIISRSAPTEARRVFEDLRALLNWAVARGDLEINPAAAMKAPELPQSRDRVLTDAELATLWNGLIEALPRSLTVQHIIRLCLLTGQRVGEAAGIEASEIDAGKMLWTIPAARSKNKHSHAVPLTRFALGLAELIAVGDRLPTHAIDKIIRRAQPRFGIAQWTMHDLRRTAVTRMAELGISPIVLGHVINHRSVTRAGVTLSVYSHYSYDKERREAIELWEARVFAIAGAHD